MTDPPPLRQQALDIWRAGVDAVDSAHLVRQHVSCDTRALHLGEHSHPFDRFDRLVVVGAGKAGAGMARGLEDAVAPLIQQGRVEGWINVPADCVAELRAIHLHAGRPAGLNEPTEEGVAGTRRILELVGGVSPRDLVVVLISGGGSALLVAPRQGVSLEDKAAVTRGLSRAGADITELNTVRRALSDVKGGGLVRASGGQSLTALIISDVVGDPLDIIASGPTVPGKTDPRQALDILHRYAGDRFEVPPRVEEFLLGVQSDDQHRASEPPNVTNLVIGSNRTALDACAEAARRLGFDVRLDGVPVTGEASRCGWELADLALRLRRDGSEAICCLRGGEPTVTLRPTDRDRKGGRNQEVVLAALDRLTEHARHCERLHDLALLSGGTDGEDGPTDAAGAVADEAVAASAQRQGLDPREYLEINNAYPFFEATGGLIHTGPTHTNVMDVQLVLWQASHP